MGASSALSAVVAGAMTAGIGAANVLAVPPDTAVPAESTRDVDLAASITIPILDIDTPGPVSISRLLTLTLTALPNNLSALFNSEAGTIYDLPGLYTNFSQTGSRNFELNRVPGQSIGAGFQSAFTDQGQWSLLDFVNGNATQGRSSAFGLDVLTGGAEGIGAALTAVLSEPVHTTPNVRNFSVGDFFEVDSEQLAGYIGEVDGRVSAYPFDGFEAVGAVAPFYRDSTASIRLGSVQALTNLNTALDGRGGVCLGSGADCDYIAQLGGEAAFTTGLAVKTASGTSNIVSVDFPNRLVATVKQGQFAVEGEIGGVVSVGDISLGRKIPVDIQIPNASAMMSSASTRQQQSVRNSFIAVPGKSGSDNGTASKSRQAAKNFVNSAISEVKTTVEKTLNAKPKHAKPEA